MIFPKPVARSDIDSTRPTGHPRRRHPPAAFLLPGYAHPPRAEKPHHGHPGVTIGPWGTAADSATVVRPAGLGNGWPPDADTGNPGASRIPSRLAIARRCPLARFSARSGVLAPGEQSDAVNSLSRGMSYRLWLYVCCFLLPFERDLEVQGPVLDRVGVPLPERSPLARDRRAGV